MAKRHQKAGTRLANAGMYVLGLAMLFLCLYPLYYVFINSISDPRHIATVITAFIPQKPTLDNYLAIFAMETIYWSFLVSVGRTAIGTLITVFFSSLFAYTLTRREMPMRMFFYRATIVTMYLNSGLIPWYLTMRAYGLENRFLLYVLPGAVNAFLMILVKTYIEQMPASLQESAFIDGADYFTVYSRIVLPLALPVIAAIAVFSAVGQWNSWADNMFLVSAPRPQTLQYRLYQLLQQTEMIARELSRPGAGRMPLLDLERRMQITPMAVRMATTFFVTLPILLVYPFLQRYFVKGLLIGAIKA